MPARPSGRSLLPMVPQRRARAALPLLLAALLLLLHYPAASSDATAAPTADEIEAQQQSAVHREALEKSRWCARPPAAAAAPAACLGSVGAWARAWGPGCVVGELRGCSG